MCVCVCVSVFLCVCMCVGVSVCIFQNIITYILKLYEGFRDRKHKLI